MVGARTMKKIKIGDACINVFLFIILFTFCVTCLYPFINQIAISFNEGMDTARGGITVFPRKFSMENYSSLFADSSYLTAGAVTVSRTILTTLLHVTVVFAAAYALTRKGLFGKKVITTIFALTMYLQAGLIPIYILYRYLGLINNFWVYVLPYGFSFYNMIIVRSFIQEIPESLEESALIDGANEVAILFKVIFPLSLPVLATIALWTVVAQWNDWTASLYYITNKKLYTLQYVLMRVIKQGEQLRKDAHLQGQTVDTAVKTTSESLKAAMLVATSLPIIAVYPFLQKYFVKGVTLGAVKG